MPSQGIGRISLWPIAGVTAWFRGQVQMGSTDRCRGGTKRLAAAERIGTGRL
jgi:hypothetical protein